MKIMIRVWVLIGFVVGAPFVVFGADHAEVRAALMAENAPDKNYMRMPAHLIAEGIRKAAAESGNSALVDLKVEYAEEDKKDLRITIDLAGKTLFEALETLAASIGDEVFVGDAVVRFIAPAEEEAVAATAHAVVDADSGAKEKGDDSGNRADFSDLSMALVFVKSDKGRGSAFLAKMKDEIYLFSNAHNLKGAEELIFTAMDGRRLKPQHFEYAKSSDLIRMKLIPEDVVGLKVLSLAPNIPMIDEKIWVYGNSAGGGVATELSGKVTGVGPSTVEVTTKFVPGNSGSPIVTRSGEVLGVATYTTVLPEAKNGSVLDKVFKQSRFKDVRYFGVRILERGWVEEPLSTFVKRTYLIEDAENYARAVYTLHAYWTGNRGHEEEVEKLYRDYDASDKVPENPDFRIRQKAVRDQLRSVVRTFRLNHEDLKEQADRISSSDCEYQVRRLVQLMVRGLKNIQQQMDAVTFGSLYLEREAEQVRKLVDEVINEVESTKDPYGVLAREKRRR